MDPQIRTGHAGSPNAVSPMPATPGAVRAGQDQRSDQVTLPISQNTVLRNTYWLLALSMLPTIAGAFVGMQINFAGLFQSAPIMTPLLMFAAMIGIAVRGHAAAQQRLGRGGAVRLHVRRRCVPDADPDGRGGLPQWRSARRTGRRDDGGDLLRDGGDRHGDQEGFLLHGEIPVHRA